MQSTINFLEITELLSYNKINIFLNFIKRN